MRAVTLRLKKIYKYYVSGRNVTVGLNGVDLTFRSGEFVAITGESGSGKSTLAHILAGILPWESGEMYLDDQPTSQFDETDWEKYRLENISFIAQNYGILPGNTVMENVVSALRLLGMEKNAVRREARKLLRRVDLWSMRRRRAGRLSSGQKQRLSIARALAKPAPILIADEPTGNLDQENSQKVIDLLAQAANERLVIMITHDFEVSREAVTREIAIHDGKIESDTVFSGNALPEGERGAETVYPRMTGGAEEDMEIGAVKGAVNQSAKISANRPANRPGRSKPMSLGWYVSCLLFRARPIWTVFMAVFFALVAFAIFAFLGTFIANLDDTSTRIYEDEAFKNNDDRRLAVIRSDRAPLTQEDYEQLLTVDYVESVERYGLVTDINYYYREGVDYRIAYWVEEEDVPGALFPPKKEMQAPMFISESLYIRTVPQIREQETFLKAGRLPEHMNEVVAAGEESLIGTTVRVFMRNRKSWGQSDYIGFDVTVVGVTDIGSGLYFDDRVAKTMYTSVMGRSVDPIYGVNSSLADHEVSPTERWNDQVEGGSLARVEVINYNKSGLEAYEVLECSGLNSSYYLKYLEVSEATFDRLVYQGGSTQAAVFIADYAYTDRVISDIRELGYKVISPYRLSSVKVDEEKANERLTTLVICMLALVVVIGAQTVVLSAMFNLEMGNFKQMSDLGLSCRCGQCALFWQILVLTVIGQGLGFCAIQIGAGQEIEKLVNIVKYLTPIHYVLLSLVHLAGMALVVLITCGMLRRQVFPLLQDGERVDLAELGEEDDE